MILDKETNESFILGFIYHALPLPRHFDTCIIIQCTSQPLSSKHQGLWITSDDCINVYNTKTSGDLLLTTFMLALAPSTTLFCIKIDGLYPQIRQLYRITSKAGISLAFNLHCKLIAALFFIVVLFEDIAD